MREGDTWVARNAEDELVAYVWLDSLGRYRYGIPGIGYGAVITEDIVTALQDVEGTMRDAGYEFKRI